MRLHSTRESVGRGEITILAVAETLLAVVASLAIVVFRGTAVHIAIGACVAPFLLLRTDASTELGIVWAEKLHWSFVYVFEWLKSHTPDDLPVVIRYLFYIPLSLVVVVVGLLYFPLGLAAVRCLSVAVALLKTPLSGLRSIPHNWARINLCTDFLHPPELIGGLETYGQPVPRVVESLRFSTFCSQILECDDERFFQGLILILGILLYGPALLYRLSLKATSVVYLPLIWVVHDSLDANEFNLRERFQDLKSSEYERLKRWYSAFVIIALTLIPVALWLLVHNLWLNFVASLSRSYPILASVLGAYICTMAGPLQLEGWHVARSLNAILTLLLFLWADSMLRQMARRGGMAASGAAAWLNVALLVRSLLSMYVIGCTAYIVAAAVDWRVLGQSHVRWLPW